MEEFHVSPPINVIGDLKLSLLKDLLCIVGRQFMNSDIWVMKEYEKKNASTNSIANVTNATETTIATVLTGFAGYITVGFAIRALAVAAATGC
ncbi:hypothetical protein PIB30_094939 [Stylosanthes scabra]|uniref:H(+)-exporting diphosphatase n=1 Tax=Stylosanthes scabra TaxID=79078 RepID=A0ABU6RW53_9FABA|nr:hypothetical protein [Stylosanthes scabra]